jgi:hypothetical protein
MPDGSVQIRKYIKGRFLGKVCVVLVPREFEPSPASDRWSAASAAATTRAAVLGRVETCDVSSCSA